MTPRVRLHLDGAYALVRPASFLGADAFAVYRRAVGGTYDRAQKCQKVPVDAVHDVLARLRAAGFVGDPDEDLRRKHLATTASRWYALQSVRERIAQIGEELHEACGRRLFDHQGPGAEWLATRFRALLADEPGVAKTLQVLVALPPNAPTLVICPSGVKGAWHGEIDRCRPQLRPIVLEGRRSFRWPAPGEILIANYDLLPGDDRLHGDGCDGYLEALPCKGCGDELLDEDHQKDCTGFAPRYRCPGCHPWLKEAAQGTVLAIDEIHYCKTPDAIRTVRAKALSKAVQETVDGRVIGITGTPIKADPLDLWTILDVIGLAREAFGTRDAFIERCRGKRVDRRLVWGIPDETIAASLQEVALRRTKADVFPNMPDKLFQEIVVPLRRNDLEVCEAAAAPYGGVDGLLRLVDRDRLKFEEVSAISLAVAHAKIPYLLDLVADLENTDRADDRGYADPLIVFSQHRSPVDALAARKGWIVIHGDVPPDERTRLVDRFQNGEFLGLAATAQALGVGVTLTRSHRMILPDLAWTPADNDQVMDRIHRAGQFERCIYWILKADHVLDRRITELILQRMRIIGATVGAASIASGGERDVEEEIRRMQDEIAQGRAIRRMPESDDRRATLELLRVVDLPTRRKHLLACSLVEEAEQIGLSDRQWDLAAALVAERTDAPALAPADHVRTNGVDTEPVADYEGARTGEEDQTMADENTPEGSEDEIASLPDLTPATLAWIETFRTMPDDQRVDAILECIDDHLTDDERDDLFARIEVRYGDDGDDGDDADGDGDEGEADGGEEAPE